MKTKYHFVCKKLDIDEIIELETEETPEWKDLNPYTKLLEEQYLDKMYEEFKQKTQNFVGRCWEISAYDEKKEKKKK